MEKRFSLPEGLLNAVGNYLATKPFNEVAQLISALQQNTKPIEEPKPKEDPAEGEAK